MAKMIMAAFADQAQADRALFELEHFGYQPQEISIISKSNKYEAEGYSTDHYVAKSAGAGATTGGVIGGLAGATAGGLLGALTGLGLPKETAQSYEKMVNEGGVVLGLSGREDGLAEAHQILERNGADGIQTVDMAQTEMADATDHETTEQYGARTQPAFGERIDRHDASQDMLDE